MKRVGGLDTTCQDITNALCHIEMIDMKNRMEKLKSTFGQVEEELPSKDSKFQRFRWIFMRGRHSYQLQESTPEITDQQKVKLFKRS